MPRLTEPRHDLRACDAALSQAFGFLGKRWNGVLIATLLRGPAGYSELRRAIHGISDSILSERLTELAGLGLLVRRVEEGPPVAVSYQLTDAGAALAPALSALTTWSKEHLAPDACAKAQQAAKDSAPC